MDELNLDVDGASKHMAAGERNLTTRRHTVGPSETAHDQVLGTHFQHDRHAVRVAPPMHRAGFGLPGLGFDPLIFSQPAYANAPSAAGFDAALPPIHVGLEPGLCSATNAALAATAVNLPFAAGLDDPTSPPHREFLHDFSPLTSATPVK